MRTKKKCPEPRPDRQMSSRERVLAAIRRQEVDHVPCCPSVNFLLPEQRVGHQYQFPFGPSQIEQIDFLHHELATDPIVSVTANYYHPAPGVTAQKWFAAGEIHKKWQTPKGELYAVAQYDQRWPHGYDIPLFTDFVGHFRKPWLENRSDLECLKYVLQPPQTRAQLDDLKFTWAQQINLAAQDDLATMAHVGTGLTGALQLFTPTELCYKVKDEPELVDEYLDFEHNLNLQEINMMLDLGVDIIRRNGFYETSDFYSPAMLKQYLGQRLNREVQLVHDAGKLAAYTLHTGVTPMVDYLRGLDFDCLLHLDMAHCSNNIPKIQAGLGSQKSFMIGPSNTYHLYSNDPDVVRQAVRDSFALFGRQGLLISACPSSHSIMPWPNTLAMIDEWRQLR